MTVVSGVESGVGHGIGTGKGIHRTPLEKGERMETTFENAKDGDKAWCLSLREWGTIKIDKSSPPPPYPIVWQGNNGKRKTFTNKGEDIPGMPQTLFWDEIKFEVPTRPKRKVTRWFKLWKGYGNKIIVYGEKMYPHLYDKPPVMGENDIGPFSFEVEE